MEKFLDVRKLLEKKDVKGLIKALKHKDDYTRRQAIGALYTLRDPKAIAPLYGVLNDKDSSVRKDAIAALAGLEGEKAVAQISGFLKDPDRYVRMTAAMNLGRIRSLAAVDPLCDMLKNDTDIVSREEAVKALGDIGDERAVAPLINGFQKTIKKNDTPINYCIALGKIKSPKAVEPLVAVLKENRYVSDIVRALAKIGTPEARKALVLFAPEKYVSWLVNEIIENETSLIIGNNTREELGNHLLEIGAHVKIPDVAAEIEHMKYGGKSGHYYENAGYLCEVIGKIGGPQAFDALSSISLSSSNVFEYSHIIAGAVRGLSYLDDSRVTEVLDKIDAKFTSVAQAVEAARTKAAK